MSKKVEWCTKCGKGDPETMFPRKCCKNCNAEPIYASAIRPRRFKKKPAVVLAYRIESSQLVQTLDGPMLAYAGDWIITDPTGRRSLCDDGLFQRTYDKVRSSIKERDT